ncbi:ABC transporter ATP-binding protein [Lacibacter luteus]|uniref:ABC transporter ATP-binding protein n=1 Tax=Lacibacter luteus TaxID=2508719 RepID=A0A4Q1CDP2_9BACT|nr:ABC transporter ATP-binding protein [Lacibacter luteus]RXK57434.1 ABC transporter ATP-binding protein [Lacibacter luteus]
MSNTVIKVENLSKQYRLGQVSTGTISHDVNRWWHRVRGKEDPYLKIGEANDRTTTGGSDYVWALRDVNFEVKQGEVLGIIGRNGAGKSTLLKLLSRTTAPTTGSIKIKGRVASLLEVGTGFHPELSGRENIYLNGAILGMTRQEITRKFDEIVAFAGVERYIDTPVKRYSSGMHVRLAFAVAAHLEPEILIVDEILAVGDAEFQKKCLGKMKDVSEKEGRTVLFVSHQMDAIARLCNRVIVLNNGTVGFNGFSDAAINYYLKGNSNSQSRRYWTANEKKPGNNFVQLLEVKVCDEIGQVKDSFFTVDPIKIVMRYQVLTDGFKYTHGFNLFDKSGIHILSSHDVDKGKINEFIPKGTYEAIVNIPANFLAEGLHQVSVAIMSYVPFSIHFHEMEVVSFIVTDLIEAENARGEYGGHFPGIVRPKLNWNMKKIEHE